jgi:hypothetical protein
VRLCAPRDPTMTESGWVTCHGLGGSPLAMCRSATGPRRSTELRRTPLAPRVSIRHMVHFRCSTPSEQTTPRGLYCTEVLRYGKRNPCSYYTYTYQKGSNSWCDSLLTPFIFLFEHIWVKSYCSLDLAKLTWLASGNRDA